MVIGIDCGHTITGEGTGAVGCGFYEQNLTRELGKEVKKLLESVGETVVDCTVDKSSNQLKDRVRKANSVKLDLFVSIHFNAGGFGSVSDGKITGTECFVSSSSSKANAPAKRITDKIARIGFKNRGVKVNGNYYVIKNTNAPAIILEVCFIDDKDDMNLYTRTVQEVAKAIAEGIVGKTIGWTEQPPKSLYAVCVGAYNIDNANKMKEELVKKGYKDTYLIKR